MPTVFRYPAPLVFLLIKYLIAFKIEIEHGQILLNTHTIITDKLSNVSW
jgi:hypothetical protein